MGRTDDLKTHGAQPPDDYDNKPELNNVFNHISTNQKKEVVEGTKSEIEDSSINEDKVYPTPNNYFVLDIETYKDRAMKDDYIEFAKTEKSKKLVQAAAIKKSIELAESKFALSPATGEVILVGLLDNNGKDMLFGLDGSTEKVILEDSWRAINTLFKAGYRMITYNGKSFDLPYMFKRALIKGIPITPTIALNQLLHPYSHNMHYDCFQVLGAEGSLEKWNYLFGYGENFESEGNIIGEMFENKEFDSIRAKNIGDLRKTARLFELLKGWVVQ